MISVKIRGFSLRRAEDTGEIVEMFVADMTVENYRHSTIREKAKKLGIGYRRWENDQG